MILPWQVWIDTGGTFTDCLAIDPSGNFRRLKILSNSAIRGVVLQKRLSHQIKVDVYWPEQKPIYQGYTIKIWAARKLVIRKIVEVDFRAQSIEVDRPITQNITGATLEITTHEEVPVLAARLLTATLLGQPFPAMEMKLGSTRGTNAILERKGARTALLVTKGFRDLLAIGTQQRPDLFALNIIKPLPLYHTVIEVNERIDAQGRIQVALSRDECKRVMQQLQKSKVVSVAIALLNSYKNSEHEQSLMQHLGISGFLEVSMSHQLSAQIKILPRAETTVANAYLAPIIHDYLRRIQDGLKSEKLKVMSSAGSLLSAKHFFPKDSLLSGPAGGVVGAKTVAALSGVDRLITFDMGGTSTDVALYNQRYDYRFESKVGDQKILSPSFAIETIAAGGGSICAFDGYKLTVGPHSAGAFPGPACYGAGGPLTITDVNLLLGRIDTAFFAMPLHKQKAQEALRQLMQQVNRQARTKQSEVKILESLAQIANEKMADAIRKVSVQQGHRPADFSLLAFGGAGGQHACAIAHLLGMQQVLIPYDAGLLSAYGIGHADIERFAEQLVLQPLQQVRSIGKLLAALEKAATQKLVLEGYSIGQVSIGKRLLFLRFKGQESTIEIEYVNEKNIVRQFRKKYEALYGHWLSSREIELESIKVATVVEGHRTKTQARKLRPYHPTPVKASVAIFHGKRLKCNVHIWEDLKPGAVIAGPALVVSKNSTTVVEPHWRFRLDSHNSAFIKQSRQSKAPDAFAESANLELFTNRFTAIAEEMGALLQRTSFSVNVKERLDFSCALLDAQGYLVVNAPHIPVHLGSLGVCVRTVVKALPMKEGGVVITNHPAFGGSHLPDVTLIKAVYHAGKKVGYVANRAHHAEIGGKQPGSMPADASALEEEGVIISPTYLVRGGVVQWDKVRAIFLNAKYPTRLPEENLADLNGALAAINLGEQLLQALCKVHGSSTIKQYMSRLKQYASGLLFNKLSSLPRAKWMASEKLDDGSVLQVKVYRTKQKLAIDFTGSAKAHAGNLNATSAIVQSVVLYVLRLLVDHPVPMNEGLMEHVQIILPDGLLNPDFTKKQPAVVGGNTEVSQRLTDTLLKAFALAACSQGTMNNFLFGNENFGYYETICGGVGAGNGFHGADAVHQHMTNTRITDPEIMEMRYPVQLVRFEIRRNSGGKGKWNGGNGVIREIKALANLNVNLLTQHRNERPFGMAGGAPGKVGKQYVVRSNGKKEVLKGVQGVTLHPGDTLVIETPGGGGYGKR